MWFNAIQPHSSTSGPLRPNAVWSMETGGSEFTACHRLQCQLAATPTICDGPLPTLSAKIHHLAGHNLRVALSAERCTSLPHRPGVLATRVYEELTAMMLVALSTSKKSLAHRNPIAPIPTTDCHMDPHRQSVTRTTAASLAAFTRLPRLVEVERSGAAVMGAILAASAGAAPD
ncbi:hypothetical protein CDV36_016345 [Fusarium kuroshium]|uniref:Uncharacterized protein n=1 Tax=Fusarium kuroshium TaxID=2010991 RepID=A0A3M2QTQ4_9HYPO|nr:hypothetical protein CDV36_016345 [Fusarium kuroshium]